jgi:predicted phosphodiesterase
MGGEMRIAIVADVHANLVALEAVLRHAEGQGAIDGLWCLGDIVGYGPQPVECVARLRELRATTVAGNHDRASTGMMDTEEFNPDAAKAALWTQAQLPQGDAAFLDALPEVAYLSPGQGPSLKAGASEAEFTLVHGTLREPIWEYLQSHEAALAHLERQETPFSLVGHTHVPTLVVQDEEYPQGCEIYYLEDGTRFRLNRERKLVINPGGVGQPRDGDPRAAYAVYDTESETVTLHRLEYDIAATQKLMEKAGLPRWLMQRLALGR